MLGVVFVFSSCLKYCKRYSSCRVSLGGVYNLSIYLVLIVAPGCFGYESWHTGDGVNDVTCVLGE